MGSRIRIAAVAALLGTGQGWAADCGPLQQVDTVDLTGPELKPLVPVSLNGSTKLFMLDTGGSVTQVGRPVVTDLKLPVEEMNVRIYDLYGNASGDMTTVKDFRLGRLGGRTDLAVSPMTSLGLPGRPDGILAPDVMYNYDVEMDFAGRHLNYFNRDHCPGRVIYWPHQALAIVPMEFTDVHIIIDTAIDGVAARTIIDTGASTTSMPADMAKRLFGIVPDGPGNTPVDNPTMPGAFKHLFSKLDFEGVAVANVSVLIMPKLIGTKDVNNGFQTGSRTQRYTDDINTQRMILGMDIMRHLRLYIAFGERKLYITEASKPAAASAN